MKKIILLPSLFALSTLSALADYEDYAGQDLTGANFSNQSLISAKFIESNLTSASFTFATLTNADFTNAFIEPILAPTSFWSANLTNANFTDAILTGSYFGSATLKDVNFTNAVINGANFEYTTSRGFTKEQLYSTASYKNRDLSAVCFGGGHFSANDLLGWDFSGQDLSYSSFEHANLANVNLSQANLTSAIFWNANLTNADLRGANINSAIGSPTGKNIIWSDGVIWGFSITSVEDSFSIRKYIPTEGSTDTISAKIAENSTISNSTLTLEAGAELELVENAILTLADGGKIVFEETADEKSILEITDGSSVEFADGASFEIRLIEDFETPQTFVVMSWTDVSKITGLNSLVKGENIFVTLGDVALNNWSFAVEADGLYVTAPEPSTYAMIFGALAIAFGLMRCRIRKIC